MDESGLAKKANKKERYSCFESVV